MVMLGPQGLSLTLETLRDRGSFCPAQLVLPHLTDAPDCHWSDLFSVLSCYQACFFSSNTYLFIRLLWVLIAECRIFFQLQRVGPLVAA